MNIIVRPGDKQPFKADIEQLPAAVEVRPGPKNPTALVAVAAFGGFVAISFGVTALLALGLLLAVAGYVWWRLSFKPHVMRFTNRGVEVEEVGLLMANRWQADYAAFDGVVLRQRTMDTPQREYVYQIIELRHPDENKTLPLYFAEMTDEPAGIWQAYAKLFGLQAIRGDDG